jgi:hypothetical protein
MHFERQDKRIPSMDARERLDSRLVVDAKDWPSKGHADQVKIILQPVASAIELALYPSRSGEQD